MANEIEVSENNEALIVLAGTVAGAAATFVASLPIPLEIKAPANSTFSWVGYNLNGGGNVTVTGTDHLFEIENTGDYTFTLYANGTAGNWAPPQTVTYNVHVIGDALPANTIVVRADIALTLAVIILLALAIFLAYRRHRKTVKTN